jgi:hypothetical protein
MTKKYAEHIATEVADRRSGTNAKVGHHRTNGEDIYVVHVTHDQPQEGERKLAYTLSK